MERNVESCAAGRGDWVSLQCCSAAVTTFVLPAARHHRLHPGENGWHLIRRTTSIDSCSAAVLQCCSAAVRAGAGLDTLLHIFARARVLFVEG